MFKNLNKKVVYKTTVKRELINSIISSIVSSIVLYVILIYYSDMLIELFKAIKGKELEFTYIMFPIFIIFYVMYALGKLTINGAFDKERRKK